MTVTANILGTYDAECPECGWVLPNVETVESADHLFELHLDDAHCLDCLGLLVDGSCTECEEAAK